MLEGAPSTLPLNRSSTFGSTLQGWEAQPLCQLLALGEVRMLRHHHQKWHAICMVLRLLRQTKKSHIQRNLSFPESHCCVIHAAVLGALSIIAFRYVYIYKYIYIYRYIVQSNLYYDHLPPTQNTSSGVKTHNQSNHGKWIATANHRQQTSAQ